ncbi:MAG: hypothetical protein NXY57DRAFT_948889 [Lentinula lateritia]|nr:MAG: hypothetical protein NXY57DRAFT_948889 [Lentinula lateritia]
MNQREHSTEFHKRWSGWPDGDVEFDVDWATFFASKELGVHWSYRSRGIKGGSITALNWQEGLTTERKCQGVFACDTCKIRKLRAPTRDDKISAMKANPPVCSVCGGYMVHHSCAVRSRLYKWRDGVHYVNGGSHDHGRPDQVLHLTAQQEFDFIDLVRRHPQATPSALAYGVSGPDGRPDVAAHEIAQPLINPDRVAKEAHIVQNVLRGQHGASGEASDFFQKLKDFRAEHPDFILCAQVDPIGIISVASPWMRARFGELSQFTDDAVNGIVSDAAHGFWKKRTDLLIISSVYNERLRCWTPGIFSYADGATSEHYRRHFLAANQIVVEQLEQAKILLSDDKLLTIIDFSQAEREGWIEAFVDIWTSIPSDTRTPEQLRERAQELLKGCREHYRASVSRIKKMIGVVGNSGDHFENLALGLLDLSSSKEFQQHVGELRASFPLANGWIAWWIREEHASMLFKSQRRMEPALWSSMPDTTNAEEAMHWRLYTAQGKNHTLFTGLQALHTVAKHFHALYDAILLTFILGNQRVRYGQPEPHKRIKERTGTTHPGRVPQGFRSTDSRSGNDGRPPDTASELIGKLKGSLYQGKLTHVLESYRLTLAELPAPSLISSGKLDKRKHAQIYDKKSLEVVRTVSTQRDNFRIFLAAEKIIGTGKDNKIYDMYPCWVWIYYAVLNYLPHRYFSGLISHFWCCTGTQVSPAHYQLRAVPKEEILLQLTATSCKQYKGSVKKFILDLVDVDRALSPVQHCYRILEGEQMCDGQHTSMQFYLSLPIVLILELGEPEAKDNMWNFPAVLPLTRSAHRESDTSEMVYDFVGRVLVGDQHFVARYSTVSTPTVPDVGNSHTPRRNGIWTYNDMEDNCSGFPFREPHARVDTHLYGSGIEAPHGKATHSVVYHLRGGTGTQKKFFERQCTELKHIHKILVHTPPDSDPLQNHIPTLSLNMSTVSMLRPSDIFWRSQNSKYSSAIAEYNSTSFNATPSPSKSPRKSPKAAKHVNPLQINSLYDAETEDLLKSPTPGNINCRCGVGEDTHKEELHGTVIQCAMCRNIEHLACQRYGFASYLPASHSFLCQGCNHNGIKEVLLSFHPGSKPIYPGYSGYLSLFHTIVLIQPYSENERTLLDHVFRPGKGALGRVSGYWYPGRIIQQEKIWWRECIWPEGLLSPPESVVWLEEDDVVSALWGQQKKRREIRLGKWNRSTKVPGPQSDEESEFRFNLFPHTEEIDLALAPHHAILDALLTDVGSITQALHVPALDYLRKKGKRLNSSVTFTGGLTLEDRARVAQWFDEKVNQGRKSQHEWHRRLPYSHALTLLIASRIKDTVGNEEDYLLLSSANEKEVYLFDKAWIHQQSDPDPELSRQFRHGVVDVESECLSLLELRMFERSKAAGKAGYYQWGLDVGCHQDDWNPYEGLEEMDARDWSFDDADELIKVNKLFSSIITTHSYYLAWIRLHTKHETFATGACNK